MSKKSRAYTAGESLGKAIIEMVHLMHQNKTAANFLIGLGITLQKEMEERSGGRGEAKK